MSSKSQPPANTTQFNVRLPAELKARLENYAQLVGRPQANVASDALADYLDWRVPQIEALKQAVAAADRGEFASADEVEQFFKAYET
ncbi:MAG: CopG family ribbon-helix-helix protein [Thiobacillus sp.]